MEKKVKSVWEREYDYICNRKTKEHNELLIKVARHNALLLDYLTERNLLSDYITYMKGKENGV